MSKLAVRLVALAPGQRQAHLESMVVAVVKEVAGAGAADEPPTASGSRALVALCCVSRVWQCNWPRRRPAATVVATTDATTEAAR